MCGIAGIVDMDRNRPIDRKMLERMAQAIHHRGPDEDGFHVEPGIGLASKRLSIVGIKDGQQPVWNEDRTVVAVFNGELFNYVEVRESLIQKGHRFRSSTDSEIIVHLWEEYGESFLDHLKGQFAFALWDQSRQMLYLARDRFGIAPLHWSQSGQRLLFGSEIKAILSSGLVDRRPDRKGLDNVFTFFCLPGERTAFEGIQSLRPGHALKVDFRANRPSIQIRQYWDFEFPDQNDHLNGKPDSDYVDEMNARLLHSVRLRLRADVPVAAYLSGGVDSSLINTFVRDATQDRYSTFTARVRSGPSEADLAAKFSRDLKSEHHDVLCDSSALSTVFPQVIQAADAPVADPNAGSLLQLSQAVSDANYKVVLTGEGADEAFAGYFWYKWRMLFGKLEFKYFRPYYWWARSMYHLFYRKAPKGEFDRITSVTGGYHAHMMVYHCTSVARWRLLNDDTLAAVQEEPAYDQLSIDREKIGRWHPLNQSLYFGYKTMLPGLLLNPRGDRPAMANSIEVRYPFLDEDLVQFACGLHPRMKVRGWFGDKFLLRQSASNRLPPQIRKRKKTMFRAPFGDTFLKNPPPYVNQLLSEESIRKADYFSSKQVGGLITGLKNNKFSRVTRLFAEMAACVVLGTQLWHHLYIDDSLCELSPWRPPA